MELKTYLKSIGLILVSILITSLIINTLYYFSLVNSNLVKYFKLLAMIISLLIGGIYIGKNSLSRGYLEGFKVSLILIILIIIFSLITDTFNFKNFIYYLIVSITAIFGGMIGINKKKV